MKYSFEPNRRLLKLWFNSVSSYIRLADKYLYLYVVN